MNLRLITYCSLRCVQLHLLTQAHIQVSLQVIYCTCKIIVFSLFVLLFYISCKGRYISKQPVSFFTVSFVTGVCYKLNLKLNTDNAKFHIFFILGKYIVTCYAIFLMFSNDTKSNIIYISDLVMANSYCQ